MAEDAQVNDKSQKWYTTLPAIIGAVTALIVAVGGVLTVLLPKAGQDSPATPSTPSSAPSTVTMVPAATVMPPGATAAGWLEYPYAQCEQGSAPAAMAITTKSAIVICQAGPGNYYYRGVRLHDDRGIELANAVHSSDGFDVKNPNDGTVYQVRQAALTIVTPDGHDFTEQVLRWWTK